MNAQTQSFKLGDIRKETEITLQNISAILAAGGSSLNHVVKVTVYLRDLQDFDQMNEVYGSFFSSQPPARTTVQAVLGFNIGTEIDVVAIVPDNNALRENETEY